MGDVWNCEARGIVFEKVRMAPCMRDRMEILCLEGRAEDCGDGVLLPHETAAALPEQDRALLQLPELSPYYMSVHADGNLGHNDLHYHIRVLRPDGMPFVNPKFLGAILEIDEETRYSLDRDQYHILRIVEESNSGIAAVSRAELPAYNSRNLAALQKSAKASGSKLDSLLSEENNRIIIPDKLDIRFREENGLFYVAPVLLQEGDGGVLHDVDAEQFQELFRKRGAKTLYKAHDGTRTRYVCAPEIREGLEQIHRTKPMPKEEMERYTRQPRELFSDDVFHFRKAEEAQDADDAYRAAAEEECGAAEDWLPEEGEIGAAYSDRVTGVAPIHRSAYYGSGHRTEWLPPEGEGAAHTEENGDGDTAADGGRSVMSVAEEEEKKVAGDSVPAQGYAEYIDSDPLIAAEEMAPQGAQIVPASPQALDIKANFDLVDYVPETERRAGALDDTALRADVKLLSYQEDGVAWMFEAWMRGYKGVLLADDMGLGKTLQTLAFIARLRKGTAGDGKPILVAAPIALLKNWQNEYQKFIAPDVFRDIVPLHGAALRRYETGGTTPNGKKKLEISLAPDTIALTTYETLRDYQFSFAEVHWGLIIVDEAQKMKNPTTGVTKAIKAMKYDYAVCLSGTPVENSWMDLWSIMDFVQPGKLGDLKEFSARYLAPLRKQDGNPRQIEQLGSRLKENLNPLFMRRMKQDHIEGLPAKHIHRCSCEMPPYQKQRYLAVIEAGKNGDIHPLEMIARLRNISLHPDLGSKQPAAFYTMPPGDVIGQSARLIKVFEVLAQIRTQEEKALIFVLSRDMQLILKHLLQEQFGMTILAPVNGEMNGTARQKIVDMFNASQGFNVLILSPEAAGVGFTITAANHVIHLSRTWNPAKEDQATDRVYRIGQERAVHVYLPMACHADFGAGGSFDEKLDELLAHKRKLSENVLFPTSDGGKDGLELARQLTDMTTGAIEAYHWSVEDVDGVKGTIFERLVAELYGATEEFHAEQTPVSHDNGADVVVLEEPHRKTGLLIQCKHREDPRKPVGKEAVQEISAAVRFYEGQYPDVRFTPVALTNAAAFTDGAVQLAAVNGVRLMMRSDLDQLLRKYPLVRNY